MSEANNGIMRDFVVKERDVCRKMRMSALSSCRATVDLAATFVCDLSAEHYYVVYRHWLQRASLLKT